MSERVQFLASDVRDLAEEFIETIQPYCERIAIAGSLRRGKPWVRDMEIVAVPKRTPQHDLFGEIVGYTNHLDEFIVAATPISPRLDSRGQGAWGERYKRALHCGVPLDLFCVLPPAQWGLIYMIRTGPADFSRRLVTPQRFGGLLPDRYTIHDGAIWSGNDLLSTPEEDDVFAVVNIRRIAPEDRS